MKPCPACEGRGYSGKACLRCSGLGVHTCICGDKDHTCGVCAGSGREKCVHCEGRGALRARYIYAKLPKKSLTASKTLDYITRHSRHRTGKLIREAYLVTRKA